MNRSNAIALGVMCLIEPKEDLWTTWIYHKEYLKKKVGRAQITPQLERTVKRVLKSLRRW